MEKAHLRAMVNRTSRVTPLARISLLSAPQGRRGRGEGGAVVMRALEKRIKETEHHPSTIARASPLHLSLASRPERSGEERRGSSSRALGPGLKSAPKLGIS